MKTKTTQTLTALALTIAFAAFAPFAQQNSLADDPLNYPVEMGGPCTVPQVDAAGVVTPFAGGEEIITVDNGNHVILKCIGKDVPNLFGKTVVLKGFICTITTPTGDEVVTTDTHAVITKSGISTLTCKFTY